MIPGGNAAMPEQTPNTPDHRRHPLIAGLEGPGVDEGHMTELRREGR